MAKKMAVLLFVVALFVFTFAPTGEQRLDFALQGVENARKAMAQEDAQDAPDTAASAGTEEVQVRLPRFTPVPTPTPEPEFDPETMATPEPTPMATPIPVATPVPTPEPTPIVRGMQSQHVTDLQNRLTELGFMYETVDGIYGKDTVNAVNDAKKFLNARYLQEHDVNAYAERYFEEVQPTIAPQDMIVDETIEPTPTPEAVEEEEETVQAHPDEPYVLNGQAEAKFLDALYNEDFDAGMQVVTADSDSTWVKRVQSRLNVLGYLYKGVDGAFGGKTTKAISHFQQVNNLAQSGIADNNTLVVLFSKDAKASDRPVHEYKVVVDISEQRVYVYQWSQNKQAYSDLVKKFRCSSGAHGTPTPLGTYDETVRIGEAWHHFKDFGACWAQYAIHIDPTGNVMFHSVLFNKRGGRPTSSSVSALGHRASHGCIRLAVESAKWMYEHITDGTTVVIQK